MASVPLTMSTPLLRAIADETKVDFPDETGGMTDVEVVRFAVREGLKPRHRNHAAQSVNRVAFEAARSAADAANSTAKGAGQTLRSAQETARGTADAEIDTIV